MLPAQSDVKPVIQPFYSPSIGIPITQPFPLHPIGTPIAEPFAPPVHPSPPSLRTNFLTSLNIYLLVFGFMFPQFIYFLVLHRFYGTSLIIGGGSTFLIFATFSYINGAKNKPGLVIISVVFHLISILFFFVSIVIFLGNLAYHLDCNTWTGAVKDCENVKISSIVGGSFIHVVVMLQVISIYGTYNLRQRYKWLKEVQESQIIFLNGNGNNQS